MKDASGIRKAELLPRHVGIIMDGNGRWAKKRGLPRSAGHVAGASNFRTITKYCSQIGIPYLTVYAFSTENWKRPQEEVKALMRLFKQYLEEALRDFTEENIRTRFIGDVSVFDPVLRGLIERVEESSKNKSTKTQFPAISIPRGSQTRISSSAPAGKTVLLIFCYGNLLTANM